MKITSYKLFLQAIPFPVEWTVSATNLKAATKKAKEEIKTHYNILTGKLISHEILSQKEI